MGHYLSDLIPDDHEFDTLYQKIERAKKELRNAPLSAFTIAEYESIQELFRPQWSKLHSSEHMKKGMQEQLRKINLLLQKVPNKS